MLLRGKRSKAGLLLFVVVACVTLQSKACRNKDEPPLQELLLQESLLAAEPDEYSATIIRTVEDGAGRQVFVTRVARSGGMFREEWSEQGEQRALIWRPDLGKSFLLFPDKRTYVESEAIAAARSENETEATSAGVAGTGERVAVAPRAGTAPRVSRDSINSDNVGPDNISPDNVNPNNISPDYINRSFGDTPAPSRVETRALADQIVEGYTCAVTEKRAEFDDGRAEVTRLFRARDLAGLALRVEVESDHLKIITERRDIQTQVPPDKFNVPTDFKKVASRAQR